MHDVARGDHVANGSRKADSTSAAKKERRIREYAARPQYRNYNGSRLSYAWIVISETVASLFAILFYSVYALALILGFFSMAHTSVLTGVMMYGGLLSLILAMPLRRFFKRLRFIHKLGKRVKNTNGKLYRYRSGFASLYGWSNIPDFAVELRGKVYECMFIPAPRRLSIFRFERAGEVVVITGILRNRFKEALGMREKAKVRKIGFEPTTRSASVIKILLANPVPYELYYFDKSEGKVVPGGSGATAFGYTIYSGNGFLNALERE